MEAAQKGVKLVKREVTRVITPGTVTDTNVLAPGENNFLLAVDDQMMTNSAAHSWTFQPVSCALRNSPVPTAGTACCSTSNTFSPREVLFRKSSKTQSTIRQRHRKTPMEDWLFDTDYASPRSARAIRNSDTGRFRACATRPRRSVRSAR